ncbi:MAG: hypothetical protein ACREKS_06830 [Candidatus Rokuibacteriota bacterium]
MKGEVGGEVPMGISLAIIDSVLALAVIHSLHYLRRVAEPRPS